MRKKEVEMKPYILIVEDEEIIARDIREKLQSVGYNCLVASTSESAIESVHKNKPDLILMDRVLGWDKDGFKIVKEINESYRIPVIYITDFSDDTTLESAELTYPFGYIIKPFDVSELRANIEVALYKARMEKSFYESEEKYRDLVEKADIAILINNVDGKFVYCNQKLADIFGYSIEEVKNMSIQELVHPDDFERVMGFHNNRILGKDVPCRYECRGIGKGNKVIHLEVVANLLKEGNNVIGTRSYLWDITKRKLMEEKSQESEELFRSVIEQSNDGIVLINQKGNIIEWNKGQELISGLKKEEVLGKPFYEIQYQMIENSMKTKETKKYIKKMLRDFFLSAEASWLNELQEIRIQHPNGVIKDIQQLPFMIRTSKGFLLCNISRDETEQKISERMLRKSEKRFRDLFETTREAIVISDKEGRIISANPAASFMFGLKKPEDLIAKRVIDIWANPEQQQKVLDVIIENGFINDFKLKSKKLNEIGNLFDVVGSATLKRDKKDEISRIEYYFHELIEPI